VFTRAELVQTLERFRKGARAYRDGSQSEYQDRLTLITFTDWLCDPQPITPDICERLDFKWDSEGGCYSNSTGEIYVNFTDDGSHVSLTDGTSVGEIQTAGQLAAFVLAISGDTVRVCS